MTETHKGLRALTIKPVPAWAIMHAGRPIEIRSWPTTHRGPLAIHAAASVQDSDTHTEYFWRLNGVEAPQWLDVGAVIGTVNVVACVPLLSLYAPHAFDKSLPEYQGDGVPPLTVKRWLPKKGELSGDAKAFAWILANPRPCRAVDCKGKLGFWWYLGPLDPIEG